MNFEVKEDLSGMKWQNLDPVYNFDDAHGSVLKIALSKWIDIKDDDIKTHR